jgi:hypothetical protein
MYVSNVSYEEIVNYWATRENECGLGVDWSEGTRAMLALRL